MVAAGFERDVGRGPARPTSGPVKGLHLRVRAAEAAVETFPDDATAPDDHAADHGVRLDPALPPPRQLQGPFHVSAVGRGEIRCHGAIAP